MTAIQQNAPSFGRFLPILLATAMLSLTPELARSQTSTETKAEAVTWQEERDELVATVAMLEAEGHTSDALAKAEQVLALERIWLGDDDEEIIATMEKLAGLAETAESWDQAEHFRQEVLAWNKLHRQEYPWQIADAQRALDFGKVLRSMKPDQRQLWARAKEQTAQVDLLYHQGRFPDAIKPASNSVAILKELVGDEHPAYAEKLSNLAFLYDQMGDAGNALPRYEQARDIFKRTLGPEHPNYTFSLNNLAMLYFRTRDFTKALPLFEEAREIEVRILGEQNPDYAITLNNLALWYGSTGDSTRALRLLEQARDIYKRALGENHYLYATSLNNLARLLARIGDYNKALSYAEEARDIRKRELGEEHPDYAQTLNNVAFLYERMGDSDHALPLYKQAADIEKRVLGEDHPDYASTLQNMAFLYERKGDYGKALPLYVQALDIRKKVLGAEHPIYANSLDYLALLCYRMGDAEKSRLLVRRAIQLQLDGIIKQVAGLSEAQMLWLGSGSVNLSGLLTITSSLVNPHNDTVISVLRRQGLALRTVAERQRLVQSIEDPAVRETYDVYLLTRRSIDRLAQAIPHTTDSHAKQQMQATLANLTARKEKLERVLAAALPEFQLQLNTASPTFEEVASSLKAKEVLAVLVHYDHVTYDPQQPGDAGETVESKYTAFLLSRDEPPRRVDLGPAEAIDSCVLPFIEKIVDFGEAHNSGQIRLARQLRSLVWEPLEAAFPAETKTVYLCPDGPLCSLPWSALAGRKPRSYLLEDFRLAVIPYPLWLLDQKRQTLPSGTTEGLLVVGGVNYDARDDSGPHHPVPNTLANLTRARTEDRREPLAFLQGTLEEVLWIGSLAKGRDLHPVTVLQDQRATEEAVGDALTRVRYAHLATHGQFVPSPQAPNLADDSFVRLSGFGGAEELRSERNPLNLTGLALSGANLPAEDILAGRQGILSGESLAGLNMQHLALVVLSACQTARGTERMGEGVYGLQRAFHVGGARNVIASYWNVHDKATSVLMQQFYENLWGTKQLPPLDALREAQLAILREYDVDTGKLYADSGDERTTPPYYWAAFMLSGAGT